MTSGDRGLGLYPGDPCFDADRPSLLPYWIDDFTESACFYNSSSVAGQVGGVIGNTANQVLGGALQNLVSPASGGGWGLLAIGLVAIVLIGRR